MSQYKKNGCMGFLVTYSYFASNYVCKSLSLYLKWEENHDCFHRWNLYITSIKMLCVLILLMFLWRVVRFVHVCFYSCTQNVFSEAKAEVIRNSLPLCPCVGGGRGWRCPGGDGKTLRGRRHAATLSYWGWLGGGNWKKENLRAYIWLNIGSDVMLFAWRCTAVVFRSDI